ncbi:MAG: hypothetical protein GTO18_09695 [Anaerolineales bacterium]|nr:hypothetical protein [Anaerolineales bacterium]
MSEIHEFRHNRGLTALLRESMDPHATSFILLHGLGGDERSMWVLEHAIPAGSFIAAPRGLHELDVGGYSWVDPDIDSWPDLDDFHSSIKELEDFVIGLNTVDGFNRERLVYMGFSQGAALAFAAASESAIRPAAVVAAAGFLPRGELNNLEGLRVFWGHGTLDDQVPISRARLDAERLWGMGIELHFCETEVGHKLGLECMRGLRKWFQKNLD